MVTTVFINDEFTFIFLCFFKALILFILSFRRIWRLIDSLNDWQILFLFIYLTHRSIRFVINKKEAIYLHFHFRARLLCLLSRNFH